MNEQLCWCPKLEAFHNNKKIPANFSSDLNDHGQPEI
jgi:hypothetical protein